MGEAVAAPLVETTIAAIDIGTTSVHLLVARATPDGRFEVLARERDAVRLGSGPADMTSLDADAIDRGVEALRRFRQVAEVHGATVSAVATSAVREAANQREFIRRARHDAGVEVEVISGAEEARLIHLGVIQAVPVFDRRVLVVDIGGGSTELVVGHGGRMLEGRSVKLGAIRLTDRFFTGDPITAEAVEACRREVRATLTGPSRELRRHGYEVAVGSSGTIANIARMAQAVRGDEPARTLNNFTFSRAEVDQVVALVVAADTLKARERLVGLDPKRADLITAGVLLVEQVMAAFGLASITLSDYALREGLLLHRIQQLGGGLHHLSDLRRSGVTHVSERFGTEREHAEVVGRLALSIYDQTEPSHRLVPEAREYLEAAAALFHVGLYVSHAAHHKHSYYLIRNAEHLTGFTDTEIEIIALVARYHRKSEPKAKHVEFASLDDDDQRIVRVLSGILRLAIALDRSHAGLVTGVGCRLEGSTLILDLEADPGADVSLERYSAADQSSALATALGLTIEIADVEDPS